MTALFGRPGEPGDVVHRREQDRGQTGQENKLGQAHAAVKRAGCFGLNEEQERNLVVSKRCFPQDISRLDRLPKARKRTMLPRCTRTAPKSDRSLLCGVRAYHRRMLTEPASL
jgi:hypothetical protein